MKTGHDQNILQSIWRVCGEMFDQLSFQTRPKSTMLAPWMMMMILKSCVLLTLINCISARTLLMPRFYGQDSAIIVDTDKSLQSKLNPKLKNAFYYNIPVYKLIQPKIVTTTTTTTPAPEVIDEYPPDLVDIARNKLGLRRLDKLPTLSELGQLLGTGSGMETVKYIRALTSNDQGISLMKAYLGSLDYDDDGGEMETGNSDTEASEDNNDTDNENIDVDYEEVLPKQPKMEATTRGTPVDAAEGSLMQHFHDLMKQYTMWSADTTTPRPVSLNPMLVAPVHPPQLPPPLLIRPPLPYHYPIPMRPVMMTQPLKPTATPTPTTTVKSTTTLSTSTTTPAPSVAPHLNSPKDQRQSSPAVAPHVKQLADIANIPPAVLDTFLQQQPKLAELAKRVSRLPLVQQHSQAIDGQLLAAVKKALFQDENLKRLLLGADTLK